MRSVRKPSNSDSKRKDLTCTEGQDTSPEVAGVEGDVNAGKRNSGEATLESDVTLLLLLLLRLRVARADDLTQHLLHLVDGELELSSGGQRE